MTNLTPNSHNALSRMVTDTVWMGTAGWHKATLRALESRGYITVQRAVNGAVRVTSTGEDYVRHHNGQLMQA